ncbi:MAG: nucleotidyltransferase family protein [Solirubrobacteraceae bacterium]
MSNLVIDAAAAEVVRALAAAGTPSVILKGAALADWYPQDLLRTYVDADVWIPPEAQATASAILSGLRFEHLAEQLDPAALPAWFENHATTWFRSSDGSKIDLHRKLQGIHKAPQAVWARLWPETEMFELADREARRLCTPARALYVTLHAAGHGADDTSAQRHLHAALRAASLESWKRAAGLARELDATDMFSTGLRLLPAGASLADELGLPAVSSVEAALYTITAPPVAFGLQQFARARGAERLRVLVRKFFPPPSFIRHWWAPAARGPLMLAVGYAYRPLWILRNAPAGWRAWRAARGRVRDQERAAKGSR